MKAYSLSLLWLIWSEVDPVYSQLASRCSLIAPNSTLVACVNRYAAVMPEPFNRTIGTTASQILQDSFRFTNVSDTTFSLVRNATFIVFDEARGQQVLGTNPTYQIVFNTSSNVVQEAPVWVPWMNSIIYSPYSQGIYNQRLINLTTTPPTIRNYTTTPPVYAVNGGKLFNGSIYWAVAGGVPFSNPSNMSQTVLQSPGIYKLNPNTSTIEVLLNNYFGTKLNSPDDLWIDSNGDVFFTDPPYGYTTGVAATFPPLPPASYRFRPSTGRVSIVENSIIYPNGIGFSPDGRTAYITATGQIEPIGNASNPTPGVEYNRLGDHSVYAFDLINSTAGKYLVNKRPIYLAEELFVDGFQVSAEGYLVGAAGLGVDVLSPLGELIVRITTGNMLVNNIQFVNLPNAGSELWIFGLGGITKVRWNLTGLVYQ